jgi:hypothetical protein
MWFHQDSETAHTAGDYFVALEGVFGDTGLELSCLSPYQRS